MRPRCAFCICQVDETRDDAFIEAVMVILADQDITALSHLDGVKRHSFNFAKEVSGGKQVPSSALCVCSFECASCWQGFIKTALDKYHAADEDEEEEEEEEDDDLFEDYSRIVLGELRVASFMRVASCSQVNTWQSAWRRRWTASVTTKMGRRTSSMYVCIGCLLRALVLVAFAFAVFRSICNRSLWSWACPA